MIDRRRLAWLLIASSSLLIAVTAQAQEAFTTRPASVRAGPDRDYPLIAQLPPGIRVVVMGCVPDYRWCDVAVDGDRGWVYAGSLAYPYRNGRVPILSYGATLGLPILSFSIGTYWDQYYRGRPWYPQREYWLRRVPQFRAPPPRPAPRRELERRGTTPQAAEAGVLRRGVPRSEVRPEVRREPARPEAASPPVRRPDVGRPGAAAPEAARPRAPEQHDRGGSEAGRREGGPREERAR